jgi:hypothetical protein
MNGKGDDTAGFIVLAALVGVGLILVARSQPPAPAPYGVAPEAEADCG